MKVRSIINVIGLDEHRILYGSRRIKYDAPAVILVLCLIMSTFFLIMMILTGVADGPQVLAKYAPAIEFLAATTCGVSILALLLIRYHRHLYNDPVTENSISGFEKP